VVKYEFNKTAIGESMSEYIEKGTRDCATLSLVERRAIMCVEKKIDDAMDIEKIMGTILAYSAGGAWGAVSVLYNSFRKNNLLKRLQMVVLADAVTHFKFFAWTSAS